MHESLGTLEPSLSGKLGREGGQGVREANRGEFGQVTEGLGQGADPATLALPQTREAARTQARAWALMPEPALCPAPPLTVRLACVHSCLIFSTLVQWLTSQNGSKM